MEVEKEKKNLLAFLCVTRRLSSSAWKAIRKFIELKVENYEQRGKKVSQSSFTLVENCWYFFFESHSSSFCRKKKVDAMLCVEWNLSLHGFRSEMVIWRFFNVSNWTLNEIWLDILWGGELILIFLHCQLCEYKTKFEFSRTNIFYELKFDIKKFTANFCIKVYVNLIYFYHSHLTWYFLNL